MAVFGQATCRRGLDVLRYRGNWRPAAKSKLLPRTSPLQSVFHGIRNRFPRDASHRLAIFITISSVKCVSISDRLFAIMLFQSSFVSQLLFFNLPGKPQPSPALSSSLGFRSIPTASTLPTFTASPQNSSEPSGGGHGSSTVGIAVGTSLGAIVLLVLIAALYFFLRRRKNNMEPEPKVQEKDDHHQAANGIAEAKNSSFSPQEIPRDPRPRGPSFRSIRTAVRLRGSHESSFRDVVVARFQTPETGAAKLSQSFFCLFSSDFPFLLLWQRQGEAKLSSEFFWLFLYKLTH